jgi:hypothetical protein
MSACARWSTAVQNLVEPLAGGLLVDGRVVQERKVDGLLGLVAFAFLGLLLPRVAAGTRASLPGRCRAAQAGRELADVAAALSLLRLAFALRLSAVAA